MQISMLLLLDLLGKLVAILMAVLMWFSAFKTTNWGAGIWATVMTYLILKVFWDFVSNKFPVLNRFSI